MQDVVSPGELLGKPLFQANDFVIYSKLGALNIRRVSRTSQPRRTGSRMDRVHGAP